jgi:hypothetical protein
MSAPIVFRPMFFFFFSEKIFLRKKLYISLKFLVTLVTLVTLSFFGVRTRKNSNQNSKKHWLLANFSWLPLQKSAIFSGYLCKNQQFFLVTFGKNQLVSLVTFSKIFLVTFSKIFLVTFSKIFFGYANITKKKIIWLLIFFPSDIISLSITVL